MGGVEIYIITMSAHNHMLLGSIRMTCQRSSEKRVNTVSLSSCGCRQWMQTSLCKELSDLADCGYSLD